MSAAPKRRKNLVTQADLDVTSSLYKLSIGRDEFKAIDRISDRHMSNLVVLITHHRTEEFFMDQFHRLHTEACAQNAVERGRRTSALQVTENRAASAGEAVHKRAGASVT